MGELDATNSAMYRGGWSPPLQPSPPKRLSRRAQEATDRLHAGTPTSTPASPLPSALSPGNTAARGRQKNVATTRRAELALVDAVADADLLGALSALHAGASPNAVSEIPETSNWPVLVLASTGGQNAAVVKLLLVAGATVEATDPSGCTPLLHAAKAGALGSVEALLQHGASVDVVIETRGGGGGGTAVQGRGKGKNALVLSTPGRHSPPPDAVAESTGHDGLVGCCLKRTHCYLRLAVGVWL